MNSEKNNDKEVALLFENDSPEWIDYINSNQDDISN